MLSFINNPIHIPMSRNFFLNRVSSPVLSPGIVQNPKKRDKKGPILTRYIGFTEGRWYPEVGVKIDHSWRCLSKLSEGDAGLEAEIMSFMVKSEKPTMFPTEEELRKGGRSDLADVIKNKGGWYSFGWAEENAGGYTDETLDCDFVEYQRRLDGYKQSDVLRTPCNDTVSLHPKDGGFSSEETYSSGNSDSELLDKPLKFGADEDSGIQGILNRLENQRNRDLGINFGENGHKNRAKNKFHGDSRDVDMSSEFASTDVGENGRIALHFRHKGTLNASEGNINTNTEPESWRSWSNKRAGFRYSEFEAAEISVSKIQVPTEEENIRGVITGTSEESAVALDKHREINHNHLRTRLQHLERELSTALRSLKSKREEFIPEEVSGSASDLQKLSDVWEFKENEFMSAQEKLRSIKAKIAVLEGKKALTLIDARRTVEVKQKRIDDARRALYLLRTTYVVWANSASEVLLVGSFDGWSTQRKMEKSKTGMFSLYLKLYPGRYEVKFIVDGVWKIDPLRPIVNNNGFENNVLIVT